MIEIIIEGRLGGPAPDGVELRIQQDQIGADIVLTADEARDLWSRLGRELEAFDERGGEPSS